MKRVVYTSLIKIYYICAGGTASSPRATLCRGNKHNSQQTQACTQTIPWGKGGPHTRTPSIRSGKSAQLARGG